MLPDFLLIDWGSKLKQVYQQNQLHLGHTWGLLVALKHLAKWKPYFENGI